MKSKKYPPALLILITIVSSVFAGPFIYRSYILYQRLSTYDYEDFPSSPQKGDQIKTILSIDENVDITIFRDRYWYKGIRYSKISDNVVDYIAPSFLSAITESDVSVQLSTNKDSYFRNILNSMKSSEVTDSLILYVFQEQKNNKGAFDRYEVVEGREGKSKLGELLDTAKLTQFPFYSNNRRGNISENYALHRPDYKKRLENKAPALLYNRQQKPKGNLILGTFEVINTSPLQIRCVNYLSNLHSDKLKSMAWKNSFSGFDLVLWIVFTLFLSLSLFFIVKTISRVISGKPIN